MTLTVIAFENIVDKGENAAKQHFLLFLHCFLSSYTFFNYQVHFSSASVFNADGS